jgi:hypothetical protein
MSEKTVSTQSELISQPPQILANLLIQLCSLFLLLLEQPSEALHLVIVYKAMQFYGLYEAAPEVLMRGNTEFSRLMNQLEREQLEEVSLGNPLA